jgi:hypothetical protein
VVYLVAPGGSLGGDALRRSGWVSPLDGHCLPAAFRESDDASLENVNGRVDREVFAS